MRSSRFSLFVVSVFLFIGLSSLASAIELTLVPTATTVAESDWIFVDIVVDDATGVAGSTFTLTYPSNVLDPLATPVTTTFFNTFVDNQEGADPSSADPWQKNTSTTGQIKLSGAYIDSDPTTGGGGAYTGQKTLFTLRFKVKMNAAQGNYQFELQQTQLCNGPAGWGVDVNNNGQYDAGDTYEGAPIILKAYGKDTTQWGTSAQYEVLLASFTSNPTAAFSVNCLDTDGDTLCDDVDDDDDNDTIPDTVEIANGTDPKDNDTDDDGIQDGAEDVNQNGVVDEGETDPNNPFDTQSITPGQFIQGIYVAYWGRAGDPGGWDYWLGLYNGGQLDYYGIAENFAPSSEGTDAYAYFDTVFNHPGDPITDQMREDFLESIYQNLFDRDSDAEGLAYWTGILKTGQISPGAFIATVIFAAYEGRQAGSVDDWNNLAAKIRIAEYYTNRYIEMEDRAVQPLQPWSVENNLQQALDVLVGVDKNTHIPTAKKEVDDELEK